MILAFETRECQASTIEEMPQATGGRAFWCGLLAAIVVAGLLSRVAHTGFRLFDKYLGDVLFRLTGQIAPVALWSAVAMTAIELFQLTRVPAGMQRRAAPHKEAAKGPLSAGPQGRRS